MDNSRDRKRRVQSVQDMIGIGSEFDKAMHGSFDGNAQAGRNMGPMNGKRGWSVRRAAHRSDTGRFIKRKL